MTGSEPVTAKVLVIGWGFLGAAVGRRLLADGRSVTGLTRSRTWRTEAGTHAGAHIIVGDAGDTELLNDALRDIEHVVFALGGHSPPTAAAQPSVAAMAMLSSNGCQLICKIFLLKSIWSASVSFLILPP